MVEEAPKQPQSQAQLSSGDPDIEVFADLLMRVQVHAGVARVDLGITEQPEGPSGQLVRDSRLQLSPRLRLIMPLEGLRQTVLSLHKVLEEVESVAAPVVGARLPTTQIN